MILINTFTEERIYLAWDYVKRLYKVFNIETGKVIYWTSLDLQTALELGHFEKISP